MFSLFLFIFYALFYYKPITVQTVPRLILLDLHTNWIYEDTLRMKLIVYRRLTVPRKEFTKTFNSVLKVFHV